jgi:hypothetical protein
MACVIIVGVGLAAGWYGLAQNASGPLPPFAPGQVLTAAQLNALVDRINALTDPLPRILQVNCNGGAMLTDALLEAKPGDTIQITGTCREAVTITTDHLTLDGQGSAVLDGGGGTQPVIDIVGARSVTIRNLTVSHGFEGIRARQGAAVVLGGVTAQDNADNGIQINEHSTARVNNCTALRNGNDGIFVGRSSSATLAGTIVSNDNARDGVHVTVGSSVSDRAIGNTAPQITTNNNVHDGIAVILHSAFNASVSGTMLVAQGNHRLGVEVNITSMFFLGTGTTLLANGNGTTGQSFSGGVGVSQNASFTTQSSGSGATLTVQDNLGRGVIVNESGMMFVGGGTVTIQGNATGGLQASGGVRVAFTGTTLAAQISQNSANGVEVNGNASLRLSGGTTVRGNAARGILLVNDAHGDLTNITVQDNGSPGIDASDSSLTVNTSTISGNRGTSDVTLSFGTRASLNGNTIGTITCDGTVLDRGSTLCPAQ